LKKLRQGENLTSKDTSELIELTSTGKILPAQIEELLLLFNQKEITPEELFGFAAKMREKALKINTVGIKNIVDSCGTGGDKTNTFNISTAAAILASAGGAVVAKHSNFGFTSKCGSSNVVQSLGIELSQSPEKAEESLRKHNIAFIHAPYFHKATFYVNEVRKKLGIRTIFNLLGPLSNPTCPTGQIIGVPDKNLCPKMAKTLQLLGCEKALVVSGISPVMDEISVCSETFFSKLEKGNIENFTIHPSDFGLKQAKISDLQGGTPQENAKIIQEIFALKINNSKTDAVLINSAALLWAGNLANSLEEALKTSKDVLWGGKALEKIIELQKIDC